MENLRRIALLALLFQIGVCFEVQNPDEPTKQDFTMVVEVGSPITLKCTALLQGTGLLESVLKWHKEQGEDGNPEGGIEVSSLASTKVTFQDIVTLESSYDADQVTVNIKIARVTEADSGLYSCFLRIDTEVKHITYHVQVYVAPSRVILTGKPTPDYNEDPGTGTLLFYSTSDEGMLECTGVHGNPAPTLSMRIEGEDNSLTGFGTPVITRILEGDVPGLQRILYNTTLTINNVQIKADQNGRRVHCVATDPRASANTPQAAVSTWLKLNVLYPPKILACMEDWKANVGDSNVKFGCSFEANPVPTVMWKSVPDRLFIYPDNKIVDSSYSAGVMATSAKTAGNLSIFQTDLTFYNINDDFFHRYELHLNNTIGSTNRGFRLDVGDTVLEIRPVGGASSYFTNSSLLLCILAAFTTYLLRQ